MSTKSKYNHYSSYNGLDRVVMIFGVPLMPAIAVFVLLLFGTLFAIKILGLIGFLFLATDLPIFLFLRYICETDDRAVNILMIEMRFRFKRKYYKEFGNTLTYLPSNYLRDGKHIQQILRQARFFK